ncbi:MAG: FAD-binding oxidoreductase [Planctomycetes bacterium]|nr:FAD-binding oxidoreductase [Planctomycetota bacterium]
MPKVDTDILIVGAGMAGAATAYHLAKRANLGVLIVEQEETAGVHSSGRNAAIIREHADEPELQQLLSDGARFLRRGELAEYEQRGLMVMGRGDDDVQEYFRRAQGSGLWCPQDGTVDVAGLLQSYLAGQEVRYKTSVEEWTEERDLLQVSTNHGTITCKLLVNAAGPWAGRLGNLPLTPLKRHLFVTTPLDWLDPDGPSVWDGAAGFYFRPESGGLLLSCCDETAAEPGDYSENPDMLLELAEKVEMHQPGLGELAVARQWVGQRTFAPDRLFVIGFDPRNDKLFHVGGLGGHGVTSSFTVGQMAADLITGGRPPGAELLSPRRLFSANELNPNQS